MAESPTYAVSKNMRQKMKAERHRDASRESVSSIIQEEQRAEIAGEPQEAMINRILDEREVMIEKADEKSSGGTKGLASKKTNGTTYKKANGLINKKTNGKIAEQQVSSAQTKTADSTVPQKSAFESLCSAVNEGQQPPDMAKEDPLQGAEAVSAPEGKERETIEEDFSIDHVIEILRMF